MPWVTSIIDDFRENFPEAGIDHAIRAGMDGQPVFHAKESGHEVGTPIPYSADKAVSMADIDLRPFNAVAAPRRKP